MEAKWGIYSGGVGDVYKFDRVYGLGWVLVNFLLGMSIVMKGVLIEDKIARVPADRFCLGNELVQGKKVTVYPS
jgi:hypothetical protein